MNLIGNSIKFTTKGSVKLLVSLADPVDAPSPRLRFDVIDTGVGLNTQQQDSLFRPFAQADSSTTRKFGGTGLGLTISKRLSVIRAEISPARANGAEAPSPHGADRFAAYSRCRQSAALVDAQFSLTIPQAQGRVLLAEDGRTIACSSLSIRQAGIDVTEVENGRWRAIALEALKGN
jgi:signal transduction histidine kinase